jgi:hypothetical protein
MDGADWVAIVVAVAALQFAAGLMVDGLAYRPWWLRALSRGFRRARESAASKGDAE